jgi:hypothetical protein
MEWTRRVVGAGIDGQSRSFELMAIRRPDGLSRRVEFIPENGGST